MKILLIDADSTIPNLALMKLSTYHKKLGDSVSILKLNIPYYPNKKKDIKTIPKGFDKYYCSIIFLGNKNYIEENGNVITYGGTGVDLNKKLDSWIENLECDYSLYDEKEFSYGFITRGCIRNCYFCLVPKKEGNIHKVSTIDKIVRHKKVKFFDNNILAYNNHLDILKELVDKKIKCCFNQGLDIRLITRENSELLKKIKYIGEYIFAFDEWDLKDIIEKKLKLLDWRKDWQFKFFIYCHPKQPIKEIIYRINWLKERKILPYIMRDITCYSSENKNFYTDICCYTNQVHIFKTMTFEDFLNKRHVKTKRIEGSLKIYNANK
ncbi:MAG: hypothetical protein ACRCXY_00960 [Fusobacteriaceae bacterium]